MTDPAKLAKLMEETKKIIRSLLLSCKDGQPLHLLEKDHMEIMGYPIPFQKLGFPSSDALLKNFPDVCRKTIGKGGVEVYKAVADEKTAHIAELVAHQKPKKVKRGAKFSQSRNLRSTHSYKPTQKYVPMSGSKSFNGPRGGRRPFLASKGVQDLRSKLNASNYNRQPQQHTGNTWNSATSNATNTRTTPVKPSNPQTQVAIRNRADPNRPQTEKEVRHNMKEVLKSFNKGVWLHMLKDIYYSHCGIHFPAEFNNRLLEWTDILRPEVMHGKAILFPALEEFQRAAAHQAIAASAGISQSSSQTTRPNATSGSYTEFTGVIESPCSLNFEEEVRAYIAHISPDVSILYLHKEDSPLPDLMTQLNDYFSQHELKSYPEVPSNCVCCTKDDQYHSWNRAAIIKTDNRTQAEVFFLDYGNTETKPISALHPVPKIFLDTPAQAIPFKLFNIAARDSQTLHKELNSLCAGCVVIAICKSFEDGIPEVVLYNAEDRTSISQKLVDFGIAMWKNPSAAPHQSLGSVSLPKPNNLPEPVIAKKIEESQLSRRDSALSLGSVSSLSSSSYETPGLTFPDSEYWAVLLTHVISPSKIYLRIDTDSSKLYSQFQDEVEDMYGSQKPMSLLTIGELYIARVSEEDGDTWSRVKALELLDRNHVQCEFVDYGSSGSVNRRQMFDILPQHKVLPYQTQLCCLYGLEQLDSMEADEKDTIMNKLIDLASEKTLIAQVISIEVGIPHVVLFDTTGEADVEINKELGSSCEELKAELPQVEETCDVVLTYVEGDGTLFVQRLGPSYLRLQAMMSSLNEHYTKQDFVSNPIVDSMVCAKFEGSWYRATVKQVHPGKKVTVYFGDYGNSSLIPITHLRKLPEHIPHLKTLPMQALSCKLSGLDSWNDDVGAEAAMLMESADPYVLMTVTAAQDECPALVTITQGSLHVNSHLLTVFEESSQSVSDEQEAEDSGLPSIAIQRDSAARTGASGSGDSKVIPSHHATTAADIPLADRAEDASLCTPPGSPPTSDSEEINGFGDHSASKLDKALSKMNMDTDSMSSPPLKFVSPPDVDNYWDVFVTKTEEPTHFVVIPLQLLKELNKLLDDIHEEYKDSKPVEGFDPSPGELCAGLSTSDGYWYRILIQDSRIDDKIKVLFVDYGNFDYIPKSTIRPLKKSFKKLELQAVRVGLHGIQPAAGNYWSTDSRQQFEQMINEKRLVATIKSVDKTKTLIDSKPSVYLHLHDTSGECTISISDELVKRGYAKYSD